MSVILITANFKFQNRSTCSKGPIKRAGKVCGDSQDLKSPGSEDHNFILKVMKSIVSPIPLKHVVGTRNGSNNWWFAQDVTKRMIMQIMINMP